MTFREATDVSHTLARPGGRRLSWAEWGAVGGRPVVYLHGTPGSRLEGGLAAAHAERAGLTLLCPERPGYGRSTRHRGRNERDVADDLAALLSERVGEPCLIAAASGGAPYALALAALHPRRVRAVGLICGLGPVDAPGALAAMVSPNRQLLALARLSRGAALALVLPALAVLRRLPPRVMAGVLRRLPPPDGPALRDGPLALALASSFCEGTRRSSAGLVDDLLCLLQPWSFDLGDVRAPVRMWHGRLDGVVPPAMAEHVASRLDDVELTWFEGEGHLSLIARHLPTILGQLAAPRPQGPPGTLRP